MLEVAATEVVEVEVEAAAFLTRMVGQTIRLHHRLTETMPRWVVRLRRLGTLRSSWWCGYGGTRAALAVAAAAAAASRPASHRTIRRGSPTADRDTSGITTSRTHRMDGGNLAGATGRARRAGR